MPARWQTKYSVFHVPSVAGQAAFGADVFSIDADSRIDHINNVRRIVSAYLEQFYGYPRRDADILALFVSYYNAVNRGDLPYFAARYLPAVAARLDAAKVGISTKYFEWPGSDPARRADQRRGGPRHPRRAGRERAHLGGRSIDLLKAREDKGVADRTAAADLKAREAEAAKKALADEQARLEAQKKATAEQEAAAKAAQAEADRLKAAGDTDGAAKAAEEAKRQADALAARAGRGQGGRREARRREAGGRRPREGARRGEGRHREGQGRDRGGEEPRAEGVELAAREDDVAQREEAARRGETDPAILGGKLYYLNIKEYLSGGHYNNDMLVINAATRQAIAEVEEADICGRKFDLFPGGVVVISTRAITSSGHYLTLLDLETLARKATGDEPVFFRSFVEVRDTSSTPSSTRQGATTSGRFNLDMKRVAVSKDPVDGDSFISFYGDLIYINRKRDDSRSWCGQADPRAEEERHHHRGSDRPSMLVDGETLPHGLDAGRTPAHDRPAAAAVPVRDRAAPDHAATARAIRDMVVRGAGAIGTAGGFGMAQAAREAPGDPTRFEAYISAASRTLAATRPTAQNLFYAVDRVLAAARAALPRVEAAREAAAREAQAIAARTPRRGSPIGEAGAPLIRDGSRVLTHCNAGWLAFTDWGTALSPALHGEAAGKTRSRLGDETRPRLQGARLTAWELAERGDRLQDHPRQRRGVVHAAGARWTSSSWGRTGSRRTATRPTRSGPTRRPFSPAKTAVPFYVAAPSPPSTPPVRTGDAIPIEERGEEEVLTPAGLTCTTLRGLFAR